MATERIGNLNFYFAADTGPLFSSEQHALDLIGETYGQEIDVIVVPIGRFASPFFELRNQLAGHFFQKMQNYQIRLVILGDMSRYTVGREALQLFIMETNRIGHHFFACSHEEMKTKLCHHNAS